MMRLISFVKGASANIKFSNSELSKMVELGGFHSFSLLSYLLNLAAESQKKNGGKSERKTVKQLWQLKK